MLRKGLSPDETHQPFLPCEADKPPRTNQQLVLPDSRLVDTLLQRCTGAVIQRRDASSGHMLAGVDSTEPVRIVVSVDVRQTGLVVEGGRQGVGNSGQGSSASCLQQSPSQALWNLLVLMKQQDTRWYSLQICQKWPTAAAYVSECLIVSLCCRAAT